MNETIEASESDFNLRLKYLREIDCICVVDDPSLPLLHAVSLERLEHWRAALPPTQDEFLRQAGFAAKPGEFTLLPSASGSAATSPGGAVLGLGDEIGPHLYGVLPRQLPSATSWRISPHETQIHDLVFGFCLGAYRFLPLKTGEPAPAARLCLSQAQFSASGVGQALRAARAVWLVRDLINTPANHLGPADLAEVAATIAHSTGAHVDVITHTSLAEMYPAVHAVGCGASRPPSVLVARWPAADDDPAAMLISICGKGICFDSGGYDLKPSGGMLRMKKDMAGAAVALGLAHLLAEARLPCRIELRLACAENMVSGNAMRPLDVVTTRKGITVEIGNTDAEGRLVLADLLADASAGGPDLLLDFATLTGAARVALGPELPALFCNDDALANMFAECAKNEHDYVWRLPLWQGYNNWLESDVADLNNVSEKPQAGAIIAALFLQRFVSAGIRWAHFDIYGWNDAARPGRPVGGEAHGLMAAFGAVSRLVLAAGRPAAKQNGSGQEGNVPA